MKSAFALAISSLLVFAHVSVGSPVPYESITSTAISTPDQKYTSVIGTPGTWGEACAFRDANGICQIKNVGDPNLPPTSSK